MKLHATKIAGVMLAEAEPRHDARGSFSRLFCMQELAPAVGSREIVQINHSFTRAVGAIRGMHFQLPPHAEMKIVRCLRGRVFDVAVDIRKGSATFLQWVAQELTPANALALVIPEGCAHGFQVLEPDSELLYLHTEFYAKDSEGGLRYDDPRIGVAWPLPATDLSERDTKHPLVSANFAGLAVS